MVKPSPLSGRDVFKEVNKTPTKIHIGIRQRHGRKRITVISGLADDLDLRKLCRALKKHCSANGRVDREDGTIMLQADQREPACRFLLMHQIGNPRDFLVSGGICDQMLEEMVLDDDCIAHVLFLCNGRHLSHTLFQTEALMPLVVLMIQFLTQRRIPEKYGLQELKA